MDIFDKVMKANNLNCIHLNQKISTTEETSLKTLACDKNNDQDSQGVQIVPEGTLTKLTIHARQTRQASCQ